MQIVANAHSSARSCFRLMGASWDTHIPHIARPAARTTASGLTQSRSCRRKVGTWSLQLLAREEEVEVLGAADPRAATDREKEIAAAATTAEAVRAVRAIRRVDSL